jgi:phosphoserine aminotransferase
MSSDRNRILNFSAGPAMMPVPVLEEIQRDLIALPGVGMSILEISHRSRIFESIAAETEESIRSLAAVPSNYRVRSGRREPPVLHGADELPA